MERSAAGEKKRSPDGLDIAWTYRPPWVATLLSSGWITYLIHTYNPSIIPWGKTFINFAVLN